MSDLNNTDIDTDVDTTDDEWVPPTRDEWEGILAKKRTADSEAASRKRWLRELGYDPKTGEKVAAAAVSGSDATDATGLNTTSVQPTQVDTAAIETAVSSKIEAVYTALAEAGVGAKSLARVSRLVDKASITIDEDGVEGLSSQVEALKTEFPELFKRSRTNGAVADATAVGAGKKTAPSASQERDWKDVMRERFNKGLV